jgi:phosphatidate cytidylyltransferase
VNVSRAADRDGAVSTLGRDVAARVASAVVLALLALAGAWFGGWVATIIVAAAVVVVYAEWIGLTGEAAWPDAVFMLAVAAAAIAAGAGLAITGLAIAVIAMAGAAVTGRVWRLAGVAYAATLGLSLLTLRLTPELGLEAIIVLFAVVWGTDTGAFFAGRLIGGPKLWPRVSPNKTWAGAVGGLAAGVVAGLVAAAIVGVQQSRALFLVAAALAVASQAGDLFESAVKRRFDAKDSGRLIPGHGGLMDRVDGLTFAAALAAVIGSLHEGMTHASTGLVQW